MEKNQKNVLHFSEIRMTDVPLVGGKNASLGEMFTQLIKMGVQIPDGFALTVNFYWRFIKENNLDKKLSDLFLKLSPKNINSVQQVGKAARNLILQAEIPDDLQKELFFAYDELSGKYNDSSVVSYPRKRVSSEGTQETLTTMDSRFRGNDNFTNFTDVAVRTSGVAEDMPNASFAGQFETYLNIKGKENLLKAVKDCFSSFFTDRAIVYRNELKLDQLKVGSSVGIQKMVRSDLGAAGVMFSCDTESGFGEVILINASYGLGENVVKGRVDPDQFYVFETTLKNGFSPIIDKRLGTKLEKLVYNNLKNAKNPVKNIATTKKERKNFVISDSEVLQLAKWSLIIEEHYKKSMDMEWAKDGRDGKLFIVQARPETVQSRKNLSVLEEYVLKIHPVIRQGAPSNDGAKVIATGLSVGQKIGSGKAHIIKSVKNIEQFKEGEVLVTEMTDPDWVPAMKIASAIVTDRGGRTCHAAIISRELGIPCIVSTGNGTKKIKSGIDITVSCAESEEGRVYEGIVPFEIKKTDILNIENTKTKILMNLGEPDHAFALRFIPNDGVGLAREEFIIANSIKIHPLALLNYEKLDRGIHPHTKRGQQQTDFSQTVNPRYGVGVKNKISELTMGWEDKTQFYVDKLSYGVGKIGAAFYPKPVIARFSDFKTNEYRSLIGGELFEEKEENPMLGFRGASRYYNEKFKNAFVLECRAIKKVREDFGLENVAVMIPFCRTVEEGKKVLQIMKENGLSQKSGLKVFVMAEIPSNIILARQFLEIFDGFSIGSNDLTQLVLGLDRDNSKIANVGNEKNEAVKELIKEAITVCKQENKYCGICGQAPSDFPDFAEFLVEKGIESMSLNPDSILKTKILVAQKEKQLK